MNILKQTFEKSGWFFQQIERCGSWAIYKRWKSEGNPHFEVVCIRSHNGFKIPGTETMAEPAEIYPSNEAWGRDGFTFTQLSDALARLKKEGGE